MFRIKNKKGNKKYTILIILIVVVGLFGMSYIVLRKKTNLTFLESCIKDGGLFIEKIILKPFHLIEKKIGDSELNDLKEKANSYESISARNKELEKQIAELKKTLELNTILSERIYLNATAINRNMDYWYQNVTIDKGAYNGVESNMPVVVSEGLVGVTSEVSTFNSTVELLTSDNFLNKISVKIEVGEHYVYGLLTGYNAEKRTFEIEGISENTDIPIGSEVTTTGLGEEMPAGLIVGYVKNITKDNFELARLVEIESKVPFDSLSYVTILKRKDMEL